MKILDTQNIHIEAYDYNLPDSQIAKYPLAQRDSSKLLVCKNGVITDSVFNTLGSYLPSDSLMVFNNTKVIQARLHFQKATGAQIEIFCLEPHAPNDYLLNFQQKEKCSWVCLVGNSKKWKEGELYKSLNVNNTDIEIRAKRLQSHGDSHIIEFAWDNSSISFAEILDAIGELPIPPYLNRKTEEQDKQTYQTVYSKIKGSVAAPTAGLHFTENVLSTLQEKGIETTEVTLHVGAGTFKPVKSDTIKEHEMHSEFISVKKETIEHLANHSGKIIAVGTTSVRTIESLYYIGELLTDQNIGEIKVNQWLPYQEKSNFLDKKEALANILGYLEKHNLNTLVANTQIMIAPGYKFKLVDGIITNFHQPKSTLLLLVSAFVGNENWHRIYDYALDNDYRFLSYGDSSLLLRD